MNVYNQRLKAKAAKRRERILRLREAGLTLSRIGKRLGISKQRVATIIGAMQQ